MSAVFLCWSVVVLGQDYPYVSNPAQGTYTTCGSGTTIDNVISNNCTITGTTTTYDCSNVKVAYWGYDASNNRHVFRIKKCSGYFNNNSSGRIIIRETSGDGIQCTNYTINNSSTSYVTAYFNGTFYGTKSLLVFLTTTNYRAYAGYVTVTLQHGAPIVGTSAANSITENTATLKGTVNPNGLSTHYYFEYGTTSSYGNTTSSSSLSASYSLSTVTKSISGLTPGTTYHYRLVAYNSDGTDYGQDKTFTTIEDGDPPVANTLSAINITENSATLRGTVNPNGLSTSYGFRYGTTTDYGTSSSSGTVSGSNTTTTVTKTITGLDPNTTYHYQIIAVNSLGHDYGEDRTFKTQAADCSWSDCTSGSCGSTQYLTANQKMTAAQYLCQHNILDNGGGSKPLRPDDNITRAELAKIAFYGLYNGSDNVESSLVSDYFPSIYPDLQNDTAYYYQAAKALLYLEYGDGISPFDRDRSVFNPTGKIERCLVLKVLLETFNIAPLSSGTNSFDDYGPSGYTSSKFWGYAQKAYNLGIVQTTHFRPNDYCTRAEAFLFLYRILTNSSITKPTPNNTLSPASSDFFIPTNLSPEVVNAKRGVENGNFCYYEKDFFNIPGYMNLDFGVSYNSYLTEMPDDIYPVKPLGKAWSHTYNMYMNVVTDNYNNKSVYVFHMQDGSLLMYANNNGTLTSLTEGNYYTLSPQTPSASSYTLTSTNQITCTFTRQSVSDGIYYLTQVKDRNNNTITINIGSGVDHYRITSVSTLGRTLNFYYTSGTDLLYYVKDPISRKVYFYYTDNQLTSLKDAKSQYTYFTYGTANTDKDLLTKIKLPEGNYVYNKYQQRKLKSMSRTSATGNTFTDISLSLTYPNGTSSSTVTENLSDNQSVTTSYTMNSKDRITGVTSGSHTDLSFQYNISGKPDLISKATDNKASIQASFTYNNKGKITSLTTTAGGESHTTSITYTSLNDIHTITDANDNTTTYEYTNGNLTSITDALNHTTNITNNSHGFPTKVTNPMGVSTNFTYNSYGNTTAISIPSLSLSKSVSYDNVSRPISSTDFDNNTTQYSYDNNDNLLSITDALNHTTSFNYDDNDNLIRITNALNRHTDLEYDNNDFMTALSFEGATRSYSYNRDGSLASFTSPNGHTFDYSYNSNGELTSDGYASYSYNSKGQLSSVSKDSKSISYSYDAFGRVSSVSYDGKTVSYTYDNVGNLLTMVYPGNKTVTYTYDAANRMTSVTDWNNHTTTYTYRNDNQLSRVQYPNNVRTTYSYDNSGRRTGMTAARNSGSGTTIASYTFTLDNNGNHTQESITEPFSSYPAIPSQSTNYTYNNANRLLTAGTTQFGYDNNGNTTSKTGRSMTYDIGNMLTGVSGDFSASYTYDGLGNRRSATRSGSTTKYVLNLLAGNPTVLMETSSSGTAQNYYIYGADGLVSRIGSDGSTTRYYVYDYRGSTVAMTDATTSANITHKYQYDDFGKVLQSEEADNNLFRYVGKYGLMYETEDLYFVRARYYDPSIGRFLSEDPIWSTNLYPYADNNPIMGIDPSGRSIESLGAGYEIYQGVKTVTSIGTQYGMSTATKTYIATEVAKDKAAADALIAGWGSSSTAASTTAASTTAASTTAASTTAASTTAASTTAASTATSTAGVGATIGAVGCGVGMAAGVVVLGQDAYKAVKNARKSDGFVDFINRQNEDGGWLYKASQKIGNTLDSIW